jgi:16S rRNA (uracil1498-N3)-methyltransferase
MPGHFTFFSEEIEHGFARFSESEAKHMVQVLRFSVGDEVWCTDGKGNRFRTELVSASKKDVKAKIIETLTIEPPTFTLVVGVLKSTDRMEWLLEKSVELGLQKLVWTACDNSERAKVFLDKLMKTCVAAMKQSHGSWLPVLEHMSFKEAIQKFGDEAYIAHCSGGLAYSAKDLKEDSVVFIGPEGDFSESEIKIAKEKGCKELQLGSRILRTETAAIAACAAANLQV